jgi:hypothetical protein
MAALVDPYTDEGSPAKLSMHRNLKSAALVSPSPRLPWNKPSNGTRQTAWHCLGFAGIMCAIVGCATPYPVARAADGRALEEDTARPPRPAVRPNGAEPALLAVANQDVGVSANLSDADLPWLSPSHIGAALREHHGDFQACQALGDVLARRVDGAVTVDWAVRANGSVHQVTLGPSTFVGDSINSCVLDVARQVTFPRSAAPTQVSWIVTFRGASREPMADATVR